MLIDYDINYKIILSELSDLSLERMIEVLFEKLPNIWSEKYIEMTPTAINILQFNDSGFEYIFDLSSELIANGIVPDDRAVEDRLVAVFGRSHPRSVKRDKR